MDLTLPNPLAVSFVQFNDMLTTAMVLAIALPWLMWSIITWRTIRLLDDSEARSPEHARTIDPRRARHSTSSGTTVPFRALALPDRRSSR